MLAVLKWGIFPIWVRNQLHLPNLCQRGNIFFFNADYLKGNFKLVKRKKKFRKCIKVNIRLEL